METRTIVVIEDEPVLRLQAMEMFEAAGLAVTGFEDGEAALGFIRANPGALAGIFTDVKLMGDTDGVDLAHLASLACPHLPIVVTSGQCGERPSGLRPFVRYLQKPWHPFDVINAMRDAALDN